MSGTSLPKLHSISNNNNNNIIMIIILTEFSSLVRLRNSSEKSFRSDTLFRLTWIQIKTTAWKKKSTTRRKQKLSGRLPCFCFFHNTKFQIQPLLASDPSKHTHNHRRHSRPSYRLSPVELHPLRQARLRFRPSLHFLHDPLNVIPGDPVEKHGSRSWTQRATVCLCLAAHNFHIL